MLETIIIVSGAAAGAMLGRRNWFSAGYTDVERHAMSPEQFALMDKDGNIPFKPTVWHDDRGRVELISRAAAATNDMQVDDVYHISQQPTGLGVRLASLAAGAIAGIIGNVGFSNLDAYKALDARMEKAAAFIVTRFHPEPKVPPAPKAPDITHKHIW